MKDLYKILNVPFSASADEIKKSYRNLAIKYHPDKNIGNKESESIFIKINKAYQILSDPESRRKYNKTCHINQSDIVTPEVFLNKIKDIRKFIFSRNRKKISSKALCLALQRLLTDHNIKYFQAKGKTYINEQIIQEVLKCCIYLSYQDKKIIIERLLLIADLDNKLVKIIFDYMNKLENKNIFFRFLSKISCKMRNIFN